MKKLINYAVFIFFIIACDEKENSNIQIYGSWLLKASYADPGDGSGKYMNVSATPPQIISFSNDGKIATKDLNGFNYQSYLLRNDSMIIFKSTNNEVSMRFSIVGDLLTINPPCIEGCGYRFQKLNK